MVANNDKVDTASYDSAAAMFAALDEYFAQRGKEIILLLIGGDKSSQQRDIKKAKGLNEQYE